MTTGGVSPRLPSMFGGAGRVLHLAGPGHELTASSVGVNAPLLTDGDRAMLRAISGVGFTSGGQFEVEGAGSRGGIVAGGIPGGYDTVTFNDGENQVTFFLAQVSADRAAGSLTGDIGPQYLRGMLLTLGGDSDSPGRRQFIERAIAYHDQLPRSANEARQRANEPTFTVTV